MSNNPEFSGLGKPISYGVKVLNLDDKMPFGKYNGRLVRVLIEDETAYMRWFADNVTRAVLSVEASNYLEEWEEADEQPKDLFFGTDWEDDIPW